MTSSRSSRVRRVPGRDQLLDLGEWDRRIPPMVAVLTPADGGVRVTGRANGWTAWRSGWPASACRSPWSGRPNYGRRCGRSPAA
ncbi:MAG: hypothetical protein IRZ07_00210 [Microbispora sp.]|nr:hypothetical protein [Microbispora sp.]